MGRVQRDTRTVPERDEQTRIGSGPYFVMITDPLSVDEEHAFAEQGEGRAAVHLPFDHLGALFKTPCD